MFYKATRWKQDQKLGSNTVDFWFYEDNIQMKNGGCIFSKQFFFNIDFMFVLRV